MHVPESSWGGHRKAMSVRFHHRLYTPAARALTSDCRQCVCLCVSPCSVPSAGIGAIHVKIKLHIHNRMDAAAPCCTTPTEARSPLGLAWACGFVDFCVLLR